MSEYGDEKFIYALTQKEELKQKNEITNDIKNGAAIIDGIQISFSRREIIRDRLFMTIPSEFELMEPELAELKYPGDKRPDIIFSNEEGAINISFSLTPDKLTNEDIEEAMVFLQTWIAKLNPACEIISSNIFEEDIRIGYFDHISNAIDSEIYNLVFLFSLEGQFILGTFNCLHLDMAAWKETAGQMLHSISKIRAN